MTTAGTQRALPRELGPGLWWLGACLELPHDGEIYHSYQSAFVLAGRDASMIIEAGMPFDIEVLEEQLAQVIDQIPPVRYLWATHQETPHAGGVGFFLDRFGEAELVGDVRDYHLFFPQFADRMRYVETGASIDLGGRRLEIVNAVFRDLATTQWGFDTATRTLFPGDGFAYAHLHTGEHCGRLAEEVPALDIAQLAGFFAEHSLNWTRFRDLEPSLAELQQQLDKLDVQIIAPTHGLPICDVPRIAPMIFAGLQALRDREMAA